MREKVNHQLYYPLEPNTSRISYLQVLLKYILGGSITAFSDEEFLVPLELSAIRTRIMRQADSTDQVSYTSDGTEVTTKILPPADSLWMFQEFRKIALKEDWFFDRQRSVMDVRIIGIAPIRFYEKNGESRFETMFWIYYPEARFAFVSAEVYNKGNDAERRTYEDIFWKRRFSSYIYKETNVYNRRINTYMSGLDALLEAEKIKEDIFNMEHDLWEY